MSFIGLIYIICFSSLALWLLFKEQKSIRKYFGGAFGVSFLGYLAYYLLFPNPVGYVYLAIGIGVLFLGGFILNTFSSNKILFILLLGGAVAVMWYIQNVKIPKFPFFGASEKTEAVTDVDLSKLDPSAELLVEVSNGHQIKELNKILKKYDLQYEPAFSVESGEMTDLDDFYAVNIPENQEKNYTAIVNDLMKSGLVDAVEQNEIVQLEPNETPSAIAPNRGNYGVNDPLLDKVWGFKAMEMNKLYTYMSKQKLKAKKKAKIAILDTGVDGSHEDLRANYTSTRTEYDEDPHGHGTHCAGIAAAVSNNGKGIASVFPNNSFVEVTSIQVFPRRGGTTQRIIINGMILAADKGADVVSMSLGGPSSDSRQRAYKEAVDYVNKKGGIVVVAAGNENMDARKRVPASVEGVITVAATDSDNTKAKFSNDVSKIKMGIAAPGVGVYSTMPGSRYDYMSGTSMATPYVAGLLGLMKALKPDLNTKDAYQILKQTGARTPSGAKTGQLIQPHAAVKTLLK
jgi:thermitase